MAAGLMVAAVLAGCSRGAPGDGPGESDTAGPATVAASPTEPTSAGADGPDEPGGAPSYDVTSPTAWLCHPDLADNPCFDGLTTVTVAADGSRRERPLRPAEDPPFDCFYVYPTVSTTPTTTAPKESAAEIVRVARAQASAFGEACRLYVPLYRQITLAGLVGGAFSDPEARETATGDVVSAFHDYLNRDNEGRPFLLLGHSQGATVLVSLIQREIDGDETLRSRLVSAMLLGGAPFLAPGSSDRGSFQNVPPCRTRSDTGCVVAYNTYAGEPPANALFGRTIDGRTVICTNPADLAGGSGLLDPVVPQPSEPGAVDVVSLTRLDDAVRARCRSTAKSTWLDIGRVPGSPLPSAVLSAPLGPDWGLHRYDVTLALGDLVDLAAHQAMVLERRDS